jgi:hypothetical protein
LNQKNQNFEGGIEAKLGIEDDVRNSEAGPSESDVFKPVTEYDTADQKWLGVDEETVNKDLREEEERYLRNFKKVLEISSAYGNLFS